MFIIATYISTVELIKETQLTANNIFYRKKKEKKSEKCLNHNY